ncbi:MAG: GGDEF domain-containing protein [Thiotrichales bacterium]|jgi:diguanylate cyclase|nr:GGDEF domain-containing protein [Thiotrichales bacterium]
MHQYTESYVESKKLAEATLADIDQRKISPNPINFLVGYEHLLKRDPFVRKKMELVNAENYEVIALEVFNHIATRICVMNSVDHVLLRLVSEVVDDLEVLGGDISGHILQLKSSLKSLLQEDISPASAGEIVHDVVDCVQDLADNTHKMKEKMHTVQSEVVVLKKKLEDSYREAHTDPLTGVGNRRALDKFFDDSLHAVTEDSPLSCIILDIDHFKKINDDYGHLVGDSVLRYIARMLANLTKGQDFIGRFGGEEFIVVMPDTNLENACCLAEKLRKSLEEAKLKVKDSQERISLTASFGVATYVKGEKSAVFFDRADKALYAAKAAGRNCVKCSV